MSCYHSIDPTNPTNPINPNCLRLQSRLCMFAAAGSRTPESLNCGRYGKNPRQCRFQRLFSDPCSADTDLNLKHAANGHSKPGRPISAKSVMGKVSGFAYVPSNLRYLCDSLPPMVETQASCGCAAPRALALPYSPWRIACTNLFHPFLYLCTEQATHLQLVRSLLLPHLDTSTRCGRAMP